MDELMRQVTGLKSPFVAPAVAQTQNLVHNSVLSNEDESYHNSNFTTKKNIPTTSIGLQNNYLRDDVTRRSQMSRKNEAVRKSTLSTNILSERVSLHQKRYDHKIAKNNSVDNMGYLSQDYESNEGNLKKLRTQNLKSDVSMGDHLSVNSERPKALYHKSTLDSHKMIKFAHCKSGIKPHHGLKSRPNCVSENMSNSEIENDIPQMNTLFSSNNNFQMPSSTSIELSEKCEVKPIKYKAFKSMWG
jgi:hypothetical protein